MSKILAGGPKRLLVKDLEKGQYVDGQKLIEWTNDTSINLYSIRRAWLRKPTELNTAEADRVCAQEY